MLQTPGGDVDQAERIIMMCRKRAGQPPRCVDSGTLPFIIPSPESATRGASLLGHWFAATISREQMDALEQIAGSPYVERCDLVGPLSRQNCRRDGRIAPLEMASYASVQERRRARVEHHRISAGRARDWCCAARDRVPHDPRSGRRGSPPAAIRTERSLPSPWSCVDVVH